MSSEPPASTTFSPSSIHILGRDGAPLPKQPQSSVRPRSRADNRAAKNITERRAIASAPTRRVRRPKQQKAARDLEEWQRKRERVNKPRWQDGERSDAVSELQRIVDLVDARIK